MLEILETLAARNNEKRAIRVLLLSRDSQERWAKDLGAAKLKVAVDFQEVALAPLTADSAAELYEKVTSRLSKEYGEPERPFLVKEFNRWLSRDQLHHLPIYITAAAIHAVRDRDDRFALGGRTLIVRLAERELDRLRAVSTKQNGFGDESLPRLAALAVARDGLDVADVHRLAAADKAEGKKLALMLPDEATGIDVIDALKKLPWWSEGRWQIKAPGIVSAAILYEVLKDRKEDNASQWLWLAIQGLEGEHTARIGRLGYDIGEIYGAADADRFANWLAECVRDDAKRASALEPLISADPLPFALWRLSIRIYETLLEQSDSQGPPADQERSRLLNNLSNRLSVSGDRPGALRAIEEAVEIYRRLAQAQPAAFEPALAMSLNNLSNRLSDSGDRPGALRAIEEAVEIYRRLAQAQPAAFGPDLAISLNNLSNRLSDSGDHAT